jgi:hypothetical protein
MASQQYIDNRKGGRPRPQGLIFANNSGILENGVYRPDGVEFEDFIILSDDNRSEINIDNNRIETRKRMINGRMRSHHIADKISVSTSWDMLPSRAFTTDPMFATDGSNAGKPTSLVTSITDEDGIKKVNPFGSPSYKDQQYTTDGGAGGVEILRWYENNPGSFWVYLAYDKYSNFDGQSSQYDRLGQYNEIVEVFFDKFDHSIVKRGGSNFDFWNISLGLEEV